MKKKMVISVLFISCYFLNGSKQLSTELGIA